MVLNILCPNYEVCNEIIKYDKDTFCKPIMDKITNKYTLLEVIKDEIPSCYSCVCIYNDEDVYDNVYLTFIDNIECVICLKEAKGVSFPRCNHYTCIPCHQRCWYGPIPDKIEFPYGEEVKRVYMKNKEIWNDDEKIQKWIMEVDKIELDRMNQWESETNLRICPICRK